MESHLTFQDFYAPLFNFVFFVFLAYVFLRKFFGSMATARREKFIQLRDSAQKARLEAQSKLDELNREYDGFELRLSEMQAKAEIEAKNEAKLIVDEAHKLAASIAQEAKTIASTELALAKNSLRRDILAEVKGLLSEKVSEEFSEAKARKFVSSQTTKLQSVTH